MGMRLKALVPHTCSYRKHAKSYLVGSKYSTIVTVTTAYYFIGHETSESSGGRCIISHHKRLSWDRNAVLLSLTPNSQGKLSKGGVRSVWSLYVQLVIALNTELWAVYWKAQWDGVNQQETGKGVPLSDCSHFQVSDLRPLGFAAFYRMPVET